MRRADGRPACICPRPPEAPAKAGLEALPAKGRSAVQVLPKRRDRWLLQLRRRDLLVGTVIDPGLGGLTLAVLLEFFEQFANAAVQQPAYARAAEHSAEIAKQSALPGRLRAAARCRIIGCGAFEHFCQLVPVLVARNREQSQKCSHRWHSAAHIRLQFEISTSATPDLMISSSARLTASYAAHPCALELRCLHASSAL